MLELSSQSVAEFEASAAAGAAFAWSDGALASAGLPAAARRALADAAKAEGFKGKAGECASLSAGSRRWILAGLGDRKGSGAEASRRAGGALLQYARGRVKALSVFPSAQARAVAEGLQLGGYRFTQYRKPDEDRLADLKLVGSGLEKDLGRALLAARAVALARDLVNRGPSDKTPESLAQVAEGLKAPGVGVKVLRKADLEKLGMGSFLGVARGSAVPPAMLHLTYKPKKAAKKTVALVGKGITFDSGGLSLKPPASMETMKMDMAGAAAVLAVFQALPELSPRVEVHGICALTYNMPGPDAMKPGDVVKAMNGKTIEVLNTDAEGRLVLADALAYAGRQEPDAIVDLATLTGAVVVALGSKVAGAMGNDRALLGRIERAAALAGEPICELPLPEDYREQIKGGVADLRNIGKARGEAGSIIGGLFLQEFVGETPWVHLDIAGTAWSDSPGPLGPAGGTGAPVRTMLEYLAAL